MQPSHRQPSRTESIVGGLCLCIAALPGNVLPAPSSTSRPNLDYFHVADIPLDDADAPAICNHWLWAQAGTGKHDGILNMEDVRPGAQPQFSGTATLSAGVLDS